MILIGASYNFPKQDWGWNYEKIPPIQNQGFKKNHKHGEAQIRSLYEQTQFEGTEIEVQTFMARWVPFVKFNVKSVLTIEQTIEAVKAMNE